MNYPNKALLDYPSEIVEKCKGIEEILTAINTDGSHLWKIRSSTKWFKRKFALDLRDMKIYYSPSSKNEHCCIGATQPQIDIAEISEVRKGWKTELFNTIETKQQKKNRRKSTASPSRRTVEEDCCFSIIYGERKGKILDLLAPTPDIADKWVFVIASLLNWYERKKLEEGYELWLKEKFNLADADNNKCLTFNETLKLLHELNIDMPENDILKLFNEANTKLATGQGERQVLDEDEFMVLYFNLLKRPEIENLFNSYASQSGVFTAKELSTFLRNEQSGYENVSVEDCNVLIKIYEYSDLKRQGLLTTSGFVSMLLSSEFDIFNYREHRYICQDMSQPLSHYYIASSHNTYIMGNQLIGKNSSEAYVDALKRGCKCVELDCWDGEDGEPIVWHGHTLTTKISFKEVLEDAIKPYAFVVSPYPLILSLEMHCSPVGRLKMATYLQSILADMLYTTDVLDDLESLPSPEKLQGKILIKAKPVYGNKKMKTKAHRVGRTVESRSELVTKSTKNFVISSGEEARVTNSQTTTVTNIEYRQSSTSSTGSTISRDVSGDALVSPLRININSNTGQKNASDIESDDSDDDESQTHTVTDNPTQSSRDALCSLVNLVQAVKFHSFEKSRLNGKCFQMSSFSESWTQKTLKESPLDFIRYNLRQLSRIYPAASRTFSSNFIPVQFWSIGCQIVTLNYQTRDIPNLINDAMFKQNGFCGYVLKPEDLRDPNLRFDPSDLSQKSPIKLKIRIISGQHLPKVEGNSEIIDPYVELKIIGLPQDTTENTLTTKKIQNNGFNPIWDETFELTVKYPELAFVCLRVRDHAQSGSDVPIGYYTIPFNSMATGYRHVRLQSIGGEPLSPATLFVHISIIK